MLRDQLLGAVAEETGQPVEALAMTPEGIAGPDGTTALTAALQICRRRNVPIEALGTFFGPKGKEVTRDLDGDRLFPDFTFGTHLADVEVDLDTGEVQVLRYVAAHDVGRAINPLSVEGQIVGAAVQGIGQALLEEIVMQDGVNLTGGFFQYLIPTAKDVPDIEAIILESGEGLGPFGARGIGEPPIGPPLAAISSAIADAVGARPTTLPSRPSACSRPSNEAVRERPATHVTCVTGTDRTRIDPSGGSTPRTPNEEDSHDLRHRGVRAAHPQVQGGLGVGLEGDPGRRRQRDPVQAALPAVPGRLEGLSRLGPRRQRVHRLLALLRGDGGRPREPAHRGGDQGPDRARHAVRPADDARRRPRRGDHPPVRGRDRHGAVHAVGRGGHADRDPPGARRHRAARRS